MQFAVRMTLTHSATAFYFVCTDRAGEMKARVSAQVEHLMQSTTLTMWIHSHGCDLRGRSCVSGLSQSFLGDKLCADCWAGDINDIYNGEKQSYPQSHILKNVIARLL